MMNRFRAFLLALAALSAAPVTAVVVMFVHREWQLLSHLLFVTFISLLYLAAVIGWGTLTYTRSRLFMSSRFQADVSAVIVTGLATLYILFLILNLLHIFLPVVVIPAITAGALFGCVKFSQYFLHSVGSEWSLTDRLLLFCLCLLLGVQIVHGWTPLIFYDAIQYHILAPAAYLKAGHFTYIRLNYLTNMPLALQLVFGSSSAFDPSGESSKLMATLFGIGMIGAVMNLLKEHGRTVSLTAGLLIAGYSSFWLPQTLGVIDFAIAALIVTGAVFLYEAFTGTPSRTWPAAFCFGLVISSRYTSALLTFIVFITFAVHALILKKIRSKELLRQTLIFASVLFLMVAPWLIKNIIYTGNPVFPLFGKQFGGYEWSAQDAAVLTQDTVGSRFEGLPRWLAVASLAKLLWSSGPVGYILLTCGFAGLFYFSPRSKLWLICITGWIGLLAWGWIHPLGGTNNIRFNAATVLFFTSSAAVLIGKSPRRAVLILPICLFSAAVAIRGVDFLLNLKESTTRKSARSALVKKNVPSWDAIQFANLNLNPQKTKLFLLGETRSFYLNVPSFAADAYHGTELAMIFQPEGQPEVWARRLHEKGITHILLSVPELNRLQTKNYLPLPEKHLKEVAAWLRSLKIVYQDGRGTYLFELNGSKV